MAFLLCSLSSIFAPASAEAKQPRSPSQQSASSEARARQLYRQGNQAQQRGELTTARDRFAEAFTAYPHYKIAANLGAVEVALKSYQDAAQHLALALRLMDEAVEDVTAKRAVVLQLFDQTKTQLVAVEVQAMALGQRVALDEIWVDGSALHVVHGRVLLSPDISHRMVARTHALASSTTTLKGHAGQSLKLRLQLYPAGRGKAYSFNSSPAPQDAPAQRPWWPAAVAGGAALTSAVASAVALGVAGAADGDALERHAEIASLTGLDAHVACSPGSGTVEGPCAAWRSARSKRTDANVFAAGGFTAAGVLAATATIYLLWPEASERSGRFMLSPTLGGASLRGAF